MCSIKKDPFVYSYTNPKWAMDVLSGSGFQRTSLLLFPDPSFIIIFWVFLHNFIFFCFPILFPFSVRWPVQSIGEWDDPPSPPSWRNFQIIMLTRIKVALWVGILLILGLRSGLNNPQSKGLERYYDENLRLSVVWVFHLGLQPCHFFPKAPTTLASPLYQMQR